MKLDTEAILHHMFWVLFSVFVVMLVLTLPGCNSYEDNTPVPNEEELISFELINESIIIPSCVACHGKNSFTKVELNNYDNILKYAVPKEPELSKLCIVVKTESMPPSSGLPNKSKDLLCNWIKQGALP